MMRKLLLTSLLALMLAAPAGAVTIEPSSEPPAPIVSDTELDQIREEQMQVAPVTSVAPAPPQESPAGMPEPSGDYGTAQELTASLGGYTEQVAKEASRADTGSRSRARGLALMIAGAAGLAGLAFGRVAMNSLSRSTAGEAQADLEEYDRSRSDPNTRDLGGDHKEYIID